MDRLVSVGEETLVYLESLDMPGHVLSASVRTGVVSLRPVDSGDEGGTAGAAPDADLVQRWRQLRGSTHSTFVLQSADATGKVLAVAPRASVDGKRSVPPPLLHRGAFASRSVSLILTDGNATTPLAQLERAPPAAELPALALWTTPVGAGGGCSPTPRAPPLQSNSKGGSVSAGRQGFLMVPLNEIVDEHYSVYFCRVAGGTDPPPTFCA